MTTTVTLHEDCYPVFGFSAAGTFEYGTDRAIADDHATVLTAKGRLIDPAADTVTDEDEDYLRDEKYHRIYD